MQSTYQNILVIRQSALGDVVNTFPITRLLRGKYPQAKISYLTGPLTASLAEMDDNVDKVIVHKRSRLPWHFLPILMRLKMARYDLVVDLQSSRYTRWLAWATSASVRLGGRPKPFYTHPVIQNIRTKQICYLYQEFLEPIGLANQPLTPRFPDMGTCVSRAKELITTAGFANKDFIVLNPGHSPTWPTKRWPSAHWVEIGKRIIASGKLPVLTGAPSDNVLCHEVAENIGEGVINLSGQTPLETLAGVLALSKAVISTDSGPMHMAAMVETPVIALFGPTHPVTSAPFGAGHKIMHHKLSCSYCFKKRCPYHHECLDEIYPDEVWDALQGILDQDR